MKDYHIINYELKTAQCKTQGAEGEPIYGISFYCGNYSKFYDISSNKYDVERLIHLLNNGNVSPDQLLYIVEDYIAEL